jgi:glutamine amidotransferase
MGNIGSIVNMLHFLGVKSFVRSDINEIAVANKIILPGVGHFDKAMNNIQKMNLKEPLVDLGIDPINTLWSFG